MESKIISEYLYLERCCQLCRDLDRVSLAGEIHPIGALCLVVQKKVGTGPEQLII